VQEHRRRRRRITEAIGHDLNAVSGARGELFG
jgi:hypothetical protein